MSPTNENNSPTDWPSVLRLHGPAVWKTIYRIIGQTEAAEDCYQETFLSAFQPARRQHVKNWAEFLRALATRRAQAFWLRYMQQMPITLRLRSAVTGTGWERVLAWAMPTGSSPTGRPTTAGDITHWMRI